MFLRIRRSNLFVYIRRASSKMVCILVLLMLVIPHFVRVRPVHAALPNETMGDVASYNRLPNIRLQTIECSSSGNLVLADTETCSLSAGSYLFDSVIIQAGGILILEGDTSSREGVTIETPILTVENGGIIHADGMGYLGAAGANHGIGAEGTNGTFSGGGAGYGGLGQDADSTGGLAYGSMSEPNDLGSSGGRGTNIYHDYLTGGNGGGLIHLIVGNTLTNNVSPLVIFL